MAEKKRINIHIDESLKDEWDKFAKEECHSTTSQMIRNAVRDYRLKYEKINQPKVNPELELGLFKIEQKINERLQKYENGMKKLTDESKNVENIEEIKDSILNILEKLQPMDKKDIAKIIRLNISKTLEVLAILQEKDKLIKRTPEGWMIA